MSRSPPQSRPTARHDNRSGLAAHEEDSVNALADLHNEHHRRTTPAQRAIDTITDHLGRPWGFIALGAVVALWAGLTAWTTKGGVEQPSFAWLELAATLAALFVAVLVLVTQRRAEQLNERRAQLTLELAMLADQKSAKIIALLKEIRRDSPELTDRPDLESEEMANPANPKAVVAALEERDPKDGDGAEARGG